MLALFHSGVLGLAATIAFASVPSFISADPRTFHTRGLGEKKSALPPETEGPPPVLATLSQTHTGERVILTAHEPTQARFDGMLADRATGQRTSLDPRLLELLRQLAAQHLGARIELVSGYRSLKLNEMLRKKGHHVASHSQHSLGNAVDFRIIPAPNTASVDGGADSNSDGEAISPLEIEKAIRGLGWQGGVGTYMKKDDWFAHADVGPNRRWDGR